MEGYKPGSVLEQVRTELTKLGKTDTGENFEALKDLFGRMQDLREEMNEAKKEASIQAAEPYLALMKELEEDYATLLKMIE